MSNKFQVNERLVRGLSPEKKEEFIKAFRAAGWMLGMIRDVLEKEIQRLILESEDDKVYDSPNYLQLQRANIAERKAMRKLVRLLPKVEQPTGDEEDGKDISIK